MGTSVWIAMKRSVSYVNLKRRESWKTRGNGRRSFVVKRKKGYFDEDVYTIITFYLSV